MLDAGADRTARNRDGKTAIQATYPQENGTEDSRATMIRRFIAEHPPSKPR